jgi:hypothetical protein
MSSVTVDELVMRIEIELDKFRSEAGQAEDIEKKLRTAIKGTGEASDEAGKKVDGMAGKVANSNKELGKQLQSIVAVTKKVVTFLGVMAGSNAIVKFTTAISNANDQLGFMSKRLGATARDIKGMDTAVAGLGGAGASAENTMKSLNQGIQEMVLMGNDSLIPFFGALGVGVVDASGNVRKMNDVLLDMSDSLSKMDPQQAYAIASAMGIDDGMANALIQGRDAMQEMLSMQEKAYVSSNEDIAASRELSKAQAFLSAQWEGMKTMLANALIPVLLKMTKVVSGWMDYLARNERTVRNFFEGITIAVGVLLIPALVKAGIAILALVAPILGTAAVVAILAAGFALLYDDYKTWAEGGKSLFDWTEFDKYIKGTNISVDSLAKGFARLLTGYDSLTDAQQAFSKWLHEKGIIDENGLSVRGLANAFKQLGKDIFDAVPAMKTMVELVGAIMDGRWGDAIDLAKQIPGQMAGTLIDASGAVLGHVGGAVDTALGHEAGAEGTISGGVKSGAAWLKDHLASWVGSGSGSGASSVGPVGGGLSNDNANSIARIAQQLGLEPNDLAQIISFETGGTFDPNARNPNSSATGLIQKMADPDGKYYGHTRDQLGAMGFDEQMEKVVKRYFQERGFSDGRTHTVGEAYEAVAGSGYKKGSKAYDLNKVWDANGDGTIGRQEAVESAQFQAHGKDWMGAQRAIQMTGIPGVPGGGSSSNQGGVQVTVGSVTVQTSATSLPEATAAGVAAGVSRSSQLINQLGGGTL